MTDVISPPYDLPDLRPFHTIQNRMRLQGGAIVTEHGSLESDDYVAAVSGWQINGMGDVEFNDATIRGTVYVGAGVIDAVTGISLPANSTSGAESPLAPAARLPRAYSIIGRDDDVLGQLSGFDYAIVLGGPLVTEMTELYARDDLWLNADQLYIGRTWGGSGHNLLGQWTTYTPSYTNVTVGNGTVIAKYIRIGQVIHVNYRLEFGTTTSFGGNIYIGMPLSVVRATAGACVFQEIGTAVHIGTCLASELDDLARVYHVNPTLNAGVVNATNPLTWATGDFLSLTITYETDAA